MSQYPVCKPRWFLFLICATLSLLHPSVGFEPKNALAEVQKGKGWELKRSYYYFYELNYDCDSDAIESGGSDSKRSGQISLTNGKHIMLYDKSGWLDLKCDGALSASMVSGKFWGKPGADARNIKHVDFGIHGRDALWLDKASLSIQTGHRNVVKSTTDYGNIVISKQNRDDWRALHLKTWGKSDDTGWCISMDRNDARGWKGHVADAFCSPTLRLTKDGKAQQRELQNIPVKSYFYYALVLTGEKPFSASELSHLQAGVSNSKGSGISKLSVRDVGSFFKGKENAILVSPSVLSRKYSPAFSPRVIISASERGKLNFEKMTLLRIHGGSTALPNGVVLKDDHTSYLLKEWKAKQCLGKGCTQSLTLPVAKHPKGLFGYPQVPGIIKDQSGASSVQIDCNTSGLSGGGTKNTISVQWWDGKNLIGNDSRNGVGNCVMQDRTFSAPIAGTPSHVSVSTNGTDAYLIDELQIFDGPKKTAHFNGGNLFTSGKPWCLSRNPTPPDSWKNKVRDNKCQSTLNFAFGKGETKSSSGPAISKQQLRSGLGTCLEYDGKSRNGANVVSRPCSNSERQKWFQKGPTIVSQEGRCLDVRARDNNVILWDCHGKANQQWSWSGGRWLNKPSGKCLDIAVSSTKSGANVIAWKCQPNGQKNQSWTELR